MEGKESCKRDKPNNNQKVVVMLKDSKDVITVRYDEKLDLFWYSEKIVPIQFYNIVFWCENEMLMQVILRHLGMVNEEVIRG